MKANKIVLNGEVLIDLTGDTVTADTLVKGIVAHDKSGMLIEGALEEYDGSVATE